MAINWDKLKHTDRNVTFYDSKDIVPKYNIDLFNAQNILPSIVKLAENWRVPYAEIIKFIIANHLERHLFSYNIYRGLLVGERALYSEQKVWRGGQEIIQKTYYDVYVYENYYISLQLPKIVEWIIFTYYDYCIWAKLYNPYEGINFKLSDTIHDVDFNYHDKELTIQDILNMCSGKKTIHRKLIYSMYSDCEQIYLPLTSIELYGHKFDISLTIPREAIINRNWDLIENVKVYSIIKPNANEQLGRDKNNWFEGYQKDMPYWNCDIVKELKGMWSK